MLRNGFERWPKLKVHVLRCLRRLPNIKDHSFFREPAVRDRVADAHSSKIIFDAIVSCSFSQEAEYRRKRWVFWQGVAQRYGVRPVYEEVCPESSPWLFPVYIDAPRERESFLAIGLKNGVIFSSWPALPDEIISNVDGDAVRRWHRLLCVPLGQRPPRKLAS